MPVFARNVIKPLRCLQCNHPRMKVAGHWLSDVGADRLLNCGKCGHVERKDLAGEARRLVAAEVARQTAAGVLKAGMGVPQRFMQPIRILSSGLADPVEG